VSKKADAKFNYVLRYVLYVKLVIHFLAAKNAQKFRNYQ